MPRLPDMPAAPDPLPQAAGTLPRLTLPLFEGPLDLLLHLIRIHEISITDIPILEVCRQYDAYLGLMQELNLEIAGDYLVMAATLTHIKSRMLLPAEPAAPGEEPEDPRRDLVRQLLEYQRVKAAAEMLRDRDDAAAVLFTRGHGGEDPLDPYRHEALLQVSLFDLLSAFKGMLENLSSATPLRVQREEISVAEKMSWILDALESGGTVRFQDLIGSLPTRAERVACFLAVLELLRLRLIVARQLRPLGEIHLEPAAPDDDADTASGADTAGGAGSAASGQGPHDDDAS